MIAISLKEIPFTLSSSLVYLPLDKAKLVVKEEDSGSILLKIKPKTFLGRLKYAMQILLSISFPIAVAEDMERLQTIY